MKRVKDFAPRILKADDERFGRTEADGPPSVLVDYSPWSDDLFIPVMTPSPFQIPPPPPPRPQRGRRVS